MAVIVTVTVIVILLLLLLIIIIVIRVPTVLRQPLSDGSDAHMANLPANVWISEGLTQAQSQF